MPTTTANLGLTLPTPNVDTGWGGTLNTDFTIIDNLFAAAGSGPSVGLNVGAGKTLSVGGTLVGAGTVILGAGDGTGTTTAPTIRGAARTGTNVVGANLTIDAANGTGTGGSGGFYFRTAPAGTTGSTANTFQNSFSVAPSGNVGVGTFSPSNKLEISSPSLFATALNRTSGAGWKSEIQWQKSGAPKFAIGSDSSDGGVNDFYIYDAVAAVNRISLNASGAIAFNGSFGTSGQILTSAGTAGPPTWTSAVTARAWVVFDGTVASPTAAAGSNIASITKNGTGDYTINFTTAMPSANYAVAITGANSGSLAVTGVVDTTTAPTASAVRIQLTYYSWPASTASAGATDSSRVSVIVFG